MLACHDEIVVECSAEQAVDAKAWLEKAMIEGMDTVLNSTDEVYVPVEVDAWIARSWGKEVSLMFRRALANSVLETIGSLQDALTQVLEPNWAEPARL